MNKHFFPAVGLFLAVMGCGGQEPKEPTNEPTQEPTNEPTPPPAEGPVTYQLDLHLVSIGGPNETVAWPVRLGQTLQIPDHASAEVITNVYTRVGCWPAEENLNMGLANAGIPAGDVAAVDTLTVELDARQLVAPHPVCYGYRTRGGAWHWKLDPITPQPVGRAGLLRADFSVGAAGVDALAVLPGDAEIRGLSYVARPHR